MTEQQPYDVLGTPGGFELRRYPACVVAEIEVAGPFARAANRAFGPLARYIGGANRSRRRVPVGGSAAGPAAGPAMTEATGPQKVAMTLPVIQQPTGRRDDYLIRFVMPAGYTAGDLPAPRDARIRVRAVPEELAAAVRFSGRWTRRAFVERAVALHRAVTAAGLLPAGPVRYARFNPPWTPFFLRRNEVVLPVRH